MKKAVKYFLVTSTIILATALIVSLFSLRYIFQVLVVDNEDRLPPTIAHLVDRLSGRQEREQPPTRPEDTIQILEGWTSRDIGQYFERQGRWQSEEFLERAGFPQVDYRSSKEMPALKDWSSDFSFLKDKPEYYGLEGYLFPDTYRIYSTSTVDEVIEKMLVNFDRKLTPQMRADIEKQGKSIYAVITMASLIEKEAPLNYGQGDNRDARIISGIFWRRLKIGQGLQSDATLSYILSDTKAQHSGQELEIDSPYNTYKYRGLPPGPICNPGILAIKAAIYPLATDYNYFLTTSDRRVIYARTYDEHLQNKYQYLR